METFWSSESRAMLASAMPSRDKIGRSQWRMDEELIIQASVVMKTLYGNGLKGQGAISPGQRPLPEPQLG